MVAYDKYSKSMDEYFSNLPRAQFETVTCPICSSHKYMDLFAKKSMRIVRCECGMMYNLTPPIQRVLDEFYEGSDSMARWTRIKTTELELERQHAKFSKAITLISAMDIRSVADIGCGNGVFLSMLSKAKPQLNLLGLDTHKLSVDKARKHNFEVRHQDIQEFLELEARQYDCITLWGVLEHVKNPKHLIKRLNYKLRDNGFLVVCVPNAEGAAFKHLREKCFSFCPQHLHYFDLNNIKNIFGNANLTYALSYTIEDEAIPVLKYLSGFDPYGKLKSPWSDKYLSTGRVAAMKRTIQEENMGYKVVAFARKVV